MSEQISRQLRNSLAWWYSVSRLIYTAGRIFVIVAKFFEVIEKYATCRTDAQAKTAIDKATSVEDYQAKEPTKNSICTFKFVWDRRCTLACN